jgi:hypothetical protein
MSNWLQKIQTFIENTWRYRKWLANNTEWNSYYIYDVLYWKLKAVSSIVDCRYLKTAIVLTQRIRDDYYWNERIDNFEKIHGEMNMTFENNQIIFKWENQNENTETEYKKVIEEIERSYNKANKLLFKILETHSKSWKL